MNSVDKLITVFAASIGYLFILACISFIVAKPGSLVSWQAQFLRGQYKDKRNLPDQQIDRWVRPIWFMFMIDSMSHFVNRGPEHPEEFPRLVLYYRLIGCLALVLLIVVTSLAILAAITGNLIIGSSVF